MWGGRKRWRPRPMPLPDTDWVEEALAPDAQWTEQKRAEIIMLNAIYESPSATNK